MTSLISRNGLVALIALGLIMFGISRLVGNEGEDGLLMKAANEFTGEDVAEEDTPIMADQQVAAAPVPAPTPAGPVVEGEFDDDSQLIDAAAGYDPTPDDGGEEQSELGSDEALIISQSEAKPAPTSSNRLVAPDGGAVVVISDEDIIQ